MTNAIEILSSRASFKSNTKLKHSPEGSKKVRNRRKSKLELGSKTQQPPSPKVNRSTSHLFNSNFANILRKKFKTEEENKLLLIETKEQARERRIKRARALLRDRSPLVLGKYPKNINMSKPLDETVEAIDEDKIGWALTG
jgi:hypothetical protein